MGRIMQMPPVKPGPTLECVNDEPQKLERVGKVHFGDDLLERVILLVAQVVEVVERDEQNWSNSLVSKMITDDNEEMNWNFFRSGIKIMKKQNNIETSMYEFFPKQKLSKLFEQKRSKRNSAWDQRQTQPKPNDLQMKIFAPIKTLIWETTRKKRIKYLPQLPQILKARPSKLGLTYPTWLATWIRHHIPSL